MGRNVKIYNSKNIGEVSGKQYSGGIIGSASYDHGNIINNCENTGNITGGKYVAGIIANSNTNTEILNSNNKGDIKAIAEGDQEANIRSAGIISTGDGVIVENCYNTGNIYTYSNSSSWPADAAGIFAYSTYDNTVVNNCYNTGNVTCEGSANCDVSGLVSSFRTSGTIYNCYNLGDVTAGNSKSNQIAVGIISTTSSYNIHNVYNLGKLTGYTTGLFRAYTNSGNINVSNIYSTGNYSIGISQSSEKVLNNVYTGKECYSSDGTYYAKTIISEEQMRTQEFIDILNEKVAENNSTSDIEWFYWDRSESNGYPMFRVKK